MTFSIAMLFLYENHVIIQCANESPHKQHYTARHYLEKIDIKLQSLSQILDMKGEKGVQVLKPQALCSSNCYRFPV